jgi:hypothetical protein
VTSVTATTARSCSDSLGPWGFVRVTVSTANTLRGTPTPNYREARERRTELVHCVLDDPVTCRVGSGRLLGEVRTGAYGALPPPSKLGCRRARWASRSLIAWRTRRRYASESASALVAGAGGMSSGSSLTWLSGSPAWSCNASPSATSSGVSGAAVAVACDLLDRSGQLRVGQRLADRGRPAGQPAVTLLLTCLEGVGSGFAVPVAGACGAQPLGLVVQLPAVADRRYEPAGGIRAGASGQHIQRIRDLLDREPGDQVVGDTRSDAGPVNREVHAGFCEGLGVQSPRATHLPKNSVLARSSRFSRSSSRNRARSATVNGSSSSGCSLR